MNTKKKLVTINQACKEVDTGEITAKEAVDLMSDRMRAAFVDFCPASHEVDAYRQIASALKASKKESDQEEWVPPTPLPLGESVQEEIGAQIWEPCDRCGQEPVYLPAHLCENCS